MFECNLHLEVHQNDILNISNHFLMILYSKKQILFFQQIKLLLFVKNLHL